MTKPRRPFTERDLQITRDLLERSRTQLSPEQHEFLTDGIELLAELMAMVKASDADDDTPVGEEFLAEAIARMHARKAR